MRTLILLLIPVFVFAGDYKKTTYTKNGKIKYSVVQNEDEQTVEIPGRDVFDLGRVDFDGAAKKWIEITGGKIPTTGKDGKISVTDMSKISASAAIDQVSAMLEASYQEKPVEKPIDEPAVIEPAVIEIKKQKQ
jgi:hypothetical protein